MCVCLPCSSRVRTVCVLCDYFMGVYCVTSTVCVYTVRAGAGTLCVTTVRVLVRADYVGVLM